MLLKRVEGSVLLKGTMQTQGGKVACFSSSRCF